MSNSNARHTPGPWEVVTTKDGFYINENLDPRWPEAETAANARLIAAAPELLESLKRVIAKLPKELTLDGEIFRDELIDLIAKATRGAECNRPDPKGDV